MAHDEVFAARYAPPLLHVDTATPARIYDYLLGGKDNFAVDRQAAAALEQREPHARLIAAENRRFLQRVVTYLVAQAGIDQIIDLGSGLPTVDNVHQIAHRRNPSVRVVYVDHDPIVLAHARALLADNPRTTVVAAQASDPAAVLSH
ncbi:SAM-dependent methyltransferase, partial [Salinactinospora qingdaonensis]|uniref:SAM-dependent methyltransferase n=1 Tax=Salinactinospora qingdaonensis TaxID=702744 RepID=UPI0031E9982C